MKKILLKNPLGTYKPIKVKTIKLISGYHLTPVDKKLLKAALEAGADFVSNARRTKSAEVTSINGDLVTAILADKYTATIGDTPRWHYQNVTIQIS